MTEMVTPGAGQLSRKKELHLTSSLPPLERGFKELDWKSYTM